MFKMKKILFLVSALLFVTMQLNAQKEPEGARYLRAFSKKMHEARSISATFSFTLQNLQENISDTHQGKILVKGKKFYLNLMGMKIYYNGKTKWQVIDEAKEVTILPAHSGEEGGFLDDPAKLFTDYDKNFKSRFRGSKRVRNRIIYEVDFFPRDLSLPYSSVRLQFDRKTLEPVMIKYQGKDGNNYIIAVKNFKVNIPIRDERFTFDVKRHKKYEVIDMR